MCGLWKPGGTWPGGKIMAGIDLTPGFYLATFTTCVIVFAEFSGATNAETESRQGRLEHEWTCRCGGRLPLCSKPECRLLWLGAICNIAGMSGSVAILILRLVIQGLNASGWKPCIHSGTYCPAYMLDMYLMLCLVLQPHQAASMQIQKPSGGGWRAQRSSKTNPHLVSGLPFTLARTVFCCRLLAAVDVAVCVCGWVGYCTILAWPPCWWQYPPSHGWGNLGSSFLPCGHALHRVHHLSLQYPSSLLRCHQHYLAVPAATWLGKSYHFVTFIWLRIVQGMRVCVAADTHCLFFPYVSPPFCGSTRRPLAGETLAVRSFYVAV